MQRSQAGIFTCHVEEGVGSPVRRHFTVTVKGKKRLKNTIEPYYFIHIDIIWLIIRNFRDFHLCAPWLKIVSKWKRSQKYEQILGDQDLWWKLKSWVHRPIWSKSHQWYFPQFAFSLLLCSCMFETVEFFKHSRGYATQL